ncbi:carboxylesterase [Viridothelium virens]|uniref:Carboxylic ester hydrolase n=1 Tax=Viridothelium virens TaxID=1048519 RepID=A0A6A6HGN8_VIRVR|nr:carboxylesterase [Viridothelium virens]
MYKTRKLCLEEDLTAQLDYGTFEGAYSSKYNISYWGKIPFAAPPTSENRFRAPQSPSPITNGTYNSTQTFPYCPQRYGVNNGTEDCLYLGLYSRPWTSGQALRPVVVVYFGGGFIEGGASFNIPPAGYPILNASAENDLVFVYPNYRVNAFGFLPGQQIKNSNTSDLNPGLLDQYAALQWTHKYISAFGGDPQNVSIWGQSAGAGSVVAQVIANNGAEQPRLFTKALASSPFWEKTYQYNAPQAQSLYDALANYTGCSTAFGNVTDSLACLKTVDTDKIREAALAISAFHTYNTSSYSWAPVIDGTFLTQPLSQAVRKDQVNIDFGWGMYNLNEGTNFIPPGLQNATNTSTAGQPAFNSSEASYQYWLRGFLPDFEESDFQEVDKLYPSAGSAEELPSYNTTYVRAGLVYRDVVLACPAYWMARAAYNRSYVGEYTISPAKHGSDTEWWNQVNPIQQTDPLIYEGYTGAFASFFATSDPNAHKLTNASQPGVPESKDIGEEFAILSDGFGNVNTNMLAKRCDYWLSVAEKIPI